MEHEAKILCYEEAYRTLRINYINRIISSVEAIQELIIRKHLTRLSRGDLLCMQHLAHELAGSGTTFGFPKITDSGRKADLFLHRALKNLPEGKTLDDAGFDEFKKLMMELSWACLAAVRD